MTTVPHQVRFIDTILATNDPNVKNPLLGQLYP